jgi:hypothetical protein
VVSGALEARKHVIEVRAAVAKLPLMRGVTGVRERSREEWGRGVEKEGGWVHAVHACTHLHAPHR